MIETTFTDWLQADDDVQLAPGILLRIIWVERGKVRIGIQAPLSVPVYRSELLSPTQRPAQ